MKEMIEMFAVGYMQEKYPENYILFEDRAIPVDNLVGLTNDEVVEMLDCGRYTAAMIRRAVRGLKPVPEPELPVLTAGSLESVVYALFLLIDEVQHMLNLDGIPFIDEYAFRFCQWAHRKG